jgi:hypothetical protein
MAYKHVPIMRKIPSRNWCGNSHIRQGKFLYKEISRSKEEYFTTMKESIPLETLKS